MKIKFPLLSVVMIAILSCSHLASAATIQFREDSLPDGSYESISVDLRSTQAPDEVREPNESLLVGRITKTTEQPGADLGRALFGFDISSIPAGSTINSITLTLTKRTEDDGSGTQDEDHTITIHELVGTIDESSVTGPTWANRDADAPTPWTTPGGDFSATVLSSYTGNAYSDAVGTQYVFPSSSDFIATAQNALDGSGTFYLEMLSEDSEADSDRGLFQFFSDDIEDDGNNEVGNFPLLTIEYIPEPASLALMLFGVASLVTWRKRLCIP